MLRHNSTTRKTKNQLNFLKHKNHWFSEEKIIGFILSSMQLDNNPYSLNFIINGYLFCSKTAICTPEEEKVIPNEKKSPGYQIPHLQQHQSNFLPRCLQPGGPAAQELHEQHLYPNLVEHLRSSAYPHQRILACEP